MALQKPWSPCTGPARARRGARAHPERASAHLQEPPSTPSRRRNGSKGSRPPSFLDDDDDEPPPAAPAAPAAPPARPPAALGAVVRAPSEASSGLLLPHPGGTPPCPRSHLIVLKLEPLSLPRSAPPPHSSARRAPPHAARRGHRLRLQWLRWLQRWSHHFGGGAGVLAGRAGRGWCTWIHSHRWARGEGRGAAGRARALPSAVARAGVGPRQPRCCPTLGGVGPWSRCPLEPLKWSRDGAGWPPACKWLSHFRAESAWTLVLAPHQSAVFARRRARAAGAPERVVGVKQVGPEATAQTAVGGSRGGPDLSAACAREAVGADASQPAGLRGGAAGVSFVPAVAAGGVWAREEDQGNGSNALPMEPLPLPPPRRQAALWRTAWGGKGLKGQRA
jgi:hypothetical protein